ncbi:type II toxin-antitoxin system Phd/YefM family antitoxin [Peptococcaceae bacterium]|nr:type II toxin-antitoxin system Phd/YefM family antitoxin [Peptococcaceae bacterium]
MKVVNVTNARSNLYNLIDQTIASSEPFQIIGKRGNAILLSEEDWKSIQESLYLLSFPGMKESIIEGINTPVEACEDVESLGWDLN